jgi:hypothetical protein
MRQSLTPSNVLYGAVPLNYTFPNKYLYLYPHILPNSIATAIYSPVSLEIGFFGHCAIRVLGSFKLVSCFSVP